MIKEINSKDNRIYKECLKLSQKKYRDREGKYIIEGFNLIEEALTNDAEISFIVVNKNIAFNSTDVMVYRMDEVLFNRISQTETSQGIIAVVEKNKFSARDLMKINSECANYIILDRLQDPGNIGTIIRTADGAGYTGIITVKGTVDVFSPKVIRAAAGSVFRIPIVQVEDNRELKEAIQSLNKKLTVTCLDTDNYYYDADLSKGIALVIGNEGNGVSPELIDMADIKIKIPMCGKLESLNAAVAAGILMYEAMRKSERETIKRG